MLFAHHHKCKLQNKDHILAIRFILFGIRHIRDAFLMNMFRWYWTVCWRQSGHRRHCKFSAADWKPNFLPGLTDMTKNVSLRWLLLCDFTV